MPQRTSTIQHATSDYFDLIVIGGGITGAGIAYSAAKKGWKIAIIDKEDFAFGTSSRSAKMIHGGLRYLQNLQVKLVKEALHEREHLLKQYPHLVKPQPFFMPVYKSAFSKIKLGIGLSGYDYLTGGSSMPKHKEISTKEIKERFPQLKTDSIKGGFIYYDAKTNDARLTNDVIQDAVELGAVALNYFELSEFHATNNSINEITCIDKLSGINYNLKSKVIVIATGIWTDELMQKLNAEDHRKYMMPSKGIHLIVNAEHLPKDCVLLLPTVNGDGRMLWCMPWEENLNIIGTTDTDYKDGKEQVWVQKEEVAYILESVNAQLKEKKLSEEDILSVYAGIRPLLNDNDEHKKSNQRSRDYQIWWNTENTLTISGGKLTSFLSMAENCIKTIEEKIIIPSLPLIENKNITDTENNSYTEKYGNKNALLIEKIKRENIQNSTLLKNYPYSTAEIIFFIRHQHAEKLDDILTRRTLITYQMKNYEEDLIENVLNIMAKELNWNNERIEIEKIEYKNAWVLMHSWK